MFSITLSIIFVLWGFFLIKVYREEVIQDWIDWLMWIMGWVFELAFLILIFILKMNYQ